MCSLTTMKQQADNFREQIKTCCSQDRRRLERQLKHIVQSRKVHKYKQFIQQLESAKNRKELRQIRTQNNSMGKQNCLERSKTGGKAKQEYTAFGSPLNEGNSQNGGVTNNC